MTLDAARAIDAGAEARVEISLDQVPRRHDAAQRDRPGDPGARRARRHQRHAARQDVPRGALRAGIYDGPDEVHHMVVARNLLRNYKDRAPWS